MYDNGANIFPFYDNFAGNTLSSLWINNTAQSTNTLSINNGISIPPSHAENNFPALYSKTTLRQGIIDFYGTIPFGGQTGIFTFASIGLGSNVNIAKNLTAAGDFNGNYGLFTGQDYDSGADNIAKGLLFGSNNLYSIIVPSNNPTEISAQVNYQNTVTSKS